MIKKNLLLVCFVIFVGAKSIAQENVIAKANEKYEEYSFSPAIDIYKKVLDKGYVSADLLKKLGNSYYYNADYSEAAKIYKRLSEEYSQEIGPEYFFRYAQTLKSLGDYEAADEAMALFVRMSSNDARVDHIEKAKDYRKEIEKNSGRYEMLPFEYNTVYSEFAPTYYKKGLLFSSDRDTGNLAKYRHTWNSKDFLDLYTVNSDSLDTNFVLKFSEEINTRLHESTSIVTKDGNTLYFTRNNFIDGNYLKDDKGAIRLKIFRATLVEGIWSQIEELPFNSDSYSVAHPSLSEDETTLYFASDMPGTHGESDIFKVIIDSEGNFGAPINLGRNINSPLGRLSPILLLTIYYTFHLMGIRV